MRGVLLLMVTGCQPSNPQQQYQQFEHKTVRLERYVEAGRYKAVSVEIGCVIATSDKGITLRALSPDLQGTEQIFVPAATIRDIIKINENEITAAVGC